MDATRFDDLARRVGAGTSRRRVLRLFGGGLAAGIGAAVFGRGHTAAQPSCSTDDDCPPDSFCGGGLCQSVECQIDDQCPEGTRCNGNFCESIECVNDIDCTEGEVCLAGSCEPAPPACSGERGLCDAGEVCCEGLVCNAETGVCEVACVVGGPCVNVPDCCVSLVCNTSIGLCVDPDACVGLGGACGDILCCNPYVCNPASGACCTPGGRRCGSDADCCDGACVVGFCTTDICRLPGETCDDFAQCCTAVCNFGACEASSCASIGTACVSNLECCTGVCADGACVLANCTRDADCPEGGACINGACRYLICATDADCPEGAVCGGASNDFPGVCQPPPPAGPCAGEGDACESDPACCEGLVCLQKICRVKKETKSGDKSDGTSSGETPSSATTLPATGVGHEDGLNPLLGAGLAAGAAAFLAGKMLRDDAAEAEPAD